MSFDTFPEFLAMGGHGLYVWLCYGAGLLVLSLSYFSPVMRRKSLIRELAQRQRRDLRSNASSGLSHPENGDLDV